MIIDKYLAPYVIFYEEPIHNALQRIVSNQGQIICGVDEHNVLKGIFTNGDFLRWAAAQSIVDLNQPVSKILNRSFIYVRENTDHDEITTKLEKVMFIPVVDDHNRLVAMARRRDHKVRIGEHIITRDSPTFIIGEIGNNHNGSLELAKGLIDACVTAGADCAKFQMRDLSSLYSNAGNANDVRENLGSQYTLDLLSRFQLSVDEMFKAFDYCKQQNILPLCTPWDLKSLELLENYGMQAYKVASADMTNYELIEALGRTGKTLICSTGMSDEREIVDTVKLMQRLGIQYILLHCNSTYPAPYKDINLNYMPRLGEIGSCLVGYSGHERGIHVPIAAVAMGAKVIEKHVTFDQSMEGNDHKVSLLPDELTAMVEGIRQVEEALGSIAPRKITQGERMNRSNLAKSLIINRDLKAGEVITAKMISIKSPGRGLQPNRINELIGQVAKRNFKDGDFFYPTDIEEYQAVARPYNFTRPWGIPVRYYDFKALSEKSNPDLVEFHLSYKDLEIDFKPFFGQSLDMDFVVHAPELFANEHILDLCTPDENYREHSIAELQRVINLTRQMKPYFRRSQLPLIIVNVGGFSRQGFLPVTERTGLYQILEESLKRLDTTGVELIPQTMPPFPWHLGGQQYHNLFLDPNEIASFCKRNNMRICFDVSHSKLACNYFKWSFREFTKLVGPYTAHLHLVDAQGIDREGLQIGEGEIDFPALFEDLNDLIPKTSFIPEIWQGHENEGEGFWTALERLEEYSKGIEKP